MTGRNEVTWGVGNYNEKKKGHICGGEEAYARCRARHRAKTAVMPTGLELS